MSPGQQIRTQSLLRGAAWAGTFSIAPYAGAAFVALADLGGQVYGAVGLGLPPAEPVAAGGGLQDVRLGDRTIVLVCAADDRAALLGRLAALLGPERPGVAARTTPAILRYALGATVRELRVVLAAAPAADRGGAVVVALRALDACWRDGAGARSLALSLLRSLPLSAASFVLHRTAAGVWSASAGGPGSDVTALHYGAASGRLYAATAAGLVWAWDGAAWARLGASLGARVWALLEAPAGTLYAAGEFAGGVLAWDGSGWAALGALGGACYALALASDGRLVAGVGAAGGVLAWGGGGWAALGAGLGAAPSVLLLGPDTKLYACGAGLVARLDGGVWVALPGVDASWGVYAALFQPDGRLIVGGDLPGYAQAWNGAAWTNLRVGGIVQALAYGARGLHLFGDFCEAGGLSLWSGCAIRRGGTYFSFELQPGSSRFVLAAAALPDGGMAVGLGGSGAGTVYAAAHVALEPAGSATCWPLIRCAYSGPAPGAPLYAVVNLTTGDELHFDGLRVLPGEVVTIDGELATVASTYRGDLSATVRAGSRPLRLAPGRSNDLLLQGDGQIAATLAYTPRYAMVDG